MPKKKSVQDLLPWNGNPYDAVEAFMGGVRDASKQEFRQPRIRASSMPFCPILFTLNDGHGEVPYKSQFYFKVGTALHELIQDNAHRNDTGRAMLWGDWKCTSCIDKANGHREKVPVGHSHCLKPSTACTVCKSNSMEWEYEEVTIEFNGISGHIDTILYVGNGMYVIVDYKTTGAPFGGKLDSKKYPFRGNVIQISLYCYVMREKYKLNVVGYSLVYVDRAKPILRPSDYVHIHQEWNETIHQRMGKKLKWVIDNIPLTKRVWNRLHVEGKAPKKKDIKKLVDLRPCTSHQKFHAWMAASFEREFEPENRLCPHLEHCTAGCKSAKQHVTKLYREVIGS